MSRWIDVRKSLRSFRFAAEGIRDLFWYENNAKVHGVAAGGVVVLGWWLRLDVLEWALIVLQIGLVWAAEAFNTAIEKLADVVSPEYRPQIKVVKDLAAGAVLVVVIMAVIVGILIFGSNLLERIAQ